GMTIAALLGHLESRGEHVVNAATLMVAVLDSMADSQIGLFATPEVVAAAKQNSTARGVLAGEEMGRVFAWMRPNDLVWNYWVNNYLLDEAATRRNSYRSRPASKCSLMPSPEGLFNDNHEVTQKWKAPPMQYSRKTISCFFST
ncbi:MAG TPA: hypothetical protein VGK96_17685, partial [Candidatus Sulfotelmatobacter sp.]